MRLGLSEWCRNYGFNGSSMADLQRSESECVVLCESMRSKEDRNKGGQKKKDQDNGEE